MTTQKLGFVKDRTHFSLAALSVLFEWPAFSGVQVIKLENACKVDEHENYEPDFLIVPCRKPETSYLPEVAPHRQWD